MATELSTRPQKSNVPKDAPTGGAPLRHPIRNEMLEHEEVQRQARDPHPSPLASTRTAICPIAAVPAAAPLVKLDQAEDAGTNQLVPEFREEWRGGQPHDNHKAARRAGNPGPARPTPRERGDGSNRVASETHGKRPLEAAPASKTTRAVTSSARRTSDSATLPPILRPTTLTRGHAPVTSTKAPLNHSPTK